MLSLRTHVIICAVLFALLFGIPIIGNIVQAMGTTTLPHGLQLPFMIGYMILFLAFGLSAIPVIVMSVLRGQAKIGDGAPFAPLVRNQNKIIWAMWILILAGTRLRCPP
jgi:nitric oxide reductase large subunit